MFILNDVRALSRSHASCLPTTTTGDIRDNVRPRVRKEEHHQDVGWASCWYASRIVRLCSSSLTICSRSGQLIGQLFSGVACDTIGRRVSLCASASAALVGATLYTAARGFQGDLSALLLFISVARGIVGVVSPFEISFFLELK